MHTLPFALNIPPRGDIQIPSWLLSLVTLTESADRKARSPNLHSARSEMATFKDMIHHSHARQERRLNVLARVDGPSLHQRLGGNSWLWIHHADGRTCDWTTFSLSDRCKAGKVMLKRIVHVSQHIMQATSGKIKLEQP